ncbi:MAG: hypothetical protein Q9P01_08070, partial [Anaerolineae bacterium]|nr:hypothetical protein [Anaerolineae bacterium]
MGWFSLALLATVMLTIVNFGDKFVIENEVGHPLAVMIFFTALNVMTVPVLWVLSGFERLAFNDSMMLLLVGTIPSLAGYFYFQAVAQEETSRIVVMFSSTKNAKKPLMGPRCRLNTFKSE